MSAYSCRSTCGCCYGCFKLMMMKITDENLKLRTHLSISVIVVEIMMMIMTNECF